GGDGGDDAGPSSTAPGQPSTDTGDEPARTDADDPDDAAPGDDATDAGSTGGADDTGDATDGDATDADNADNTDDTVAAGDRGTGGTVATALEALADTEGNRRWSVVIDYDAAASLVAVDRPVGADDATARPFFEAIGDRTRLLVPTALGPFGPEVFRVEAWRAEVGYALVDSRWDAYGGRPPEQVQVSRIDLSVEDVVAAVRADPVWSADLVEEEVDGLTYFAWGDPMLPVIERVSPPRPLGRGGLLHVGSDGLAVRAIDPATMDAALATVAGTATPLGADGRFRAVADALDDRGVYSAVLTDQPVLTVPLPGPASPDEVREAFEAAAPDGAPRTLPWQVLGMGQTLDPSGAPLEVVVFAPFDGIDATAAVEAFTRVIEEGTSAVTGGPFAEQFSVVETSAEDGVAVIVLAAERPGIVLQAFQVGDSLLAIG
ncbi:MAG: hypothetical protein AAF547_25220, partial [Actinomycetota bacterium]